MTDTCDLCCDRCGGVAFHHFLGPDRRGQRRWQNRCDACGRVSEYVPTRSEIETQCRELRDQQGQLPLDDEQEKLWRQLADPADGQEDADDNDLLAAAQFEDGQPRIARITRMKRFQTAVDGPHRRSAGG